MSPKRKFKGCKSEFVENFEKHPKLEDAILDEYVSFEERNSIVFSQYEIVKRICSFLADDDLNRFSKVNRQLQRASFYELKSRKRMFPTFRWTNPSQSIHPWYDLGGTKTLKFHMQQGCLESAKKWSDEYLCHNEEEEGSFNLLIGTGATYLNYLSSKNFDFIVNEDVDAIQCFHNKLFAKKSKTLMFTTLKVLGSLESSSHTERNEENNLSIGPDLTFLHIRGPPNGIEIRPFNLRGSNIFDGIDDSFLKDNIRSEEEFNRLAFKVITGVDPSLEKIRGLVIFNIGDLIHIVRQIWQESGPFPLIGCESESLCWLIDDNKKSSLENEGDDSIKPPDIPNYTSCTSGFVILGDENLKTASIVLGMETTTEESISERFQQLHSLNVSSSNRRSWGLMLSSCMRGYDGDDVSREHVEERNRIQSLECKLFGEVVGGNFIGAQVEDIVGTNHIEINNGFGEVQGGHFVGLHDSHKLLTPEIISDDYSSVFFVAHC